MQQEYAAQQDSHYGGGKYGGSDAQMQQMQAEQQGGGGGQQGAGGVASASPSMGAAGVGTAPDDSYGWQWDQPPVCNHRIRRTLCFCFSYRVCVAIA